MDCFKILRIRFSTWPVDFNTQYGFMKVIINSQSNSALHKEWIIIDLIISVIVSTARLFLFAVINYDSLKFSLYCDFWVLEALNFKNPYIYYLLIVLGGESHLLLSDLFNSFWGVVECFYFLLLQLNFNLRLVQVLKE